MARCERGNPPWKREAKTALEQPYGNCDAFLVSALGGGFVALLAMGLTGALGSPHGNLFWTVAFLWWAVGAFTVWEFAVKRQQAEHNADHARYAQAAEDEKRDLLELKAAVLERRSGR